VQEPDRLHAAAGDDRLERNPRRRQRGHDAIPRRRRQVSTGGDRLDLRGGEKPHQLRDARDRHLDRTAHVARRNTLRAQQRDEQTCQIGVVPAHRTERLARPLQRAEIPVEAKLVPDEVRPDWPSRGTLHDGSVH
jgi:hypothetical protein